MARGKGAERRRRQARSVASRAAALCAALPDLVIESILDKLTVHERANAMLTNKRWRDISIGFVADASS
jgi:hypothetical protein